MILYIFYYLSIFIVGFICICITTFYIIKHNFIVEMYIGTTTLVNYLVLSEKFEDAKTLPFIGDILKKFLHTCQI